MAEKRKYTAAADTKRPTVLAVGHVKEAMKSSIAMLNATSLVSDGGFLDLQVQISWY